MSDFFTIMFSLIRVLALPACPELFVLFGVVGADIVGCVMCLPRVDVLMGVLFPHLGMWMWMTVPGVVW